MCLKSKPVISESGLDSASKLSQTACEGQEQQDDKIHAKFLDQGANEIGRSRNKRKGNPKKIVEMNYDDTGEVSDIDDITVMGLSTGNS